MSVELGLMDVTARILDVAQVAEVAAEDEIPAWLGGLMGMVVVLGALAMIWVSTAIVGTYFAKAEKRKTGLGKTEAAPKAQTPAPAPAAKVSRAADEIPLAVIIAAAAAVVGEQIRNVVVHVSGHESVAWTFQGRQAIYASHALKAPAAVGNLSGVRGK